jgi:hypothetical protein
MEKLKEYKKHIYDVDALASFKALGELTKNNFSLEITREEYLNRIESGIKAFCKKRRLDYERYKGPLPYLLIPSTATTYPNFLGYTLMTTETYNIKLLLDYQNHKYKGKNDFINVIEFQALETVINHSPFDNSKRIEQIIEWIRENKPKKSKASSKDVVKTKTLEWMSSFDLSEFSDKLHFHGYFSKRSEFAKAILHNTPAEFKKNTKELLYLLYKLNHHEIIKSKGGKGYLATGLALFDSKSFTHQTGNAPHSLLNKVKEEDSYSDLRKPIDSLIEKHLLPKK